MFGALKRGWRTIRRPVMGQEEENEKNEDDPHEHLPERYIAVQRGRISLEPPKYSEWDREKKSCHGPQLERDLREQLEIMSRSLRTKERRAMQACRDHKTLQSRIAKQESFMQLLQNENKALHDRVKQYEHCLDDVMRKVVDALVAEENLRDEVIMLKNRVRDLEEQNASLIASPAKGRDEGYCTMSSGPPQPNMQHLEDLPEEPEQWLVSSEAMSGEMEDWSMSQEELETALEEDSSDWIYRSSQFLNSTLNSNSADISELLQEQIIYSDDEDLVCKKFTRDFYRLVNVHSGSACNLRSPGHSHLDCSSSDEDMNERLGLHSPTNSESSRIQVYSCSSSSDSGEVALPNMRRHETGLFEEVMTGCQEKLDLIDTKTSWRRSNGWRRVSGQFNDHQISNIPTLPVYSSKPKSSPPVPLRRSSSYKAS